MSAPLITTDVNGSPYLGVYAAANDDLVLLAPTTPRRVADEIAAALGARAVVASVGGATVVGALVALNSRGAVVADIAGEEELALLRKHGLAVCVLEGRVNAAGNNVLCNDHGALVHPELRARERDAIRAALGVARVEPATIAGLGTVGSAAVATNKGCLTHPKIAPREKERLEAVLGVPSKIGTVNFGMPYVGAGLVANGAGAAIGRLTTGPELNRLEDALGFL